VERERSVERKRGVVTGSNSPGSGPAVRTLQRTDTPRAPPTKAGGTPAVGPGASEFALHLKFLSCRPPSRAGTATEPAAGGDVSSKSNSNSSSTTSSSTTTSSSSSATSSSSSSSTGSGSSRGPWAGTEGREGGEDVPVWGPEGPLPPARFGSRKRHPRYAQNSTFFCSVLYSTFCTVQYKKCSVLLLRHCVDAHIIIAWICAFCTVRCFTYLLLLSSACLQLDVKWRAHPTHASSHFANGRGPEGLQGP